MEEIALGAGAWTQLPEAMREVSLANAPAFIAEQRDPDAVVLDVNAIADLACPVLLTQGDASPLWLRLLADRLSTVLPDADTQTIAGAGHVPHLTHPAEYTELVAGFIDATLAVGVS
jgi:pimeloyl-ACP methyl ester carboxylesterase